jgi:hypothetical protein
MEADAQGMDFAALAAVPAGQQAAIRFQLQPPARVVVSRYPILALWEANQEHRDGTPDRFEGADRVLVSRREGGTHLELLDEGDASFLQALARSSTLEEALEGAPQDWEFAARLQHFATRGVISGFAVAAP